ncbi:hypothetical protein J6590_013200 [Homalodisca vitripennis]|nr:hypothetical protein J6590_013200 [Homalodisca vitripennis]
MDLQDPRGLKMEQMVAMETPEGGKNVFFIVVVDPSQLKAALHQLPLQSNNAKITLYEDDDTSEEEEGRILVPPPNPPSSTPTPSVFMNVLNSTTTIYPIFLKALLMESREEADNVCN